MNENNKNEQTGQINKGKLLAVTLGIIGVTLAIIALLAAIIFAIFGLIWIFAEIHISFNSLAERVILSITLGIFPPIALTVSIAGLVISQKNNIKIGKRLNKMALVLSIVLFLMWFSLMIDLVDSRIAGKDSILFLFLNFSL